MKRRAGEGDARPRPSEPWPEQRVDPRLAIARRHRANQRRVGRRLGGIVAAAHVHLDVTEAVLREVLLQELERAFRRHVGNEAHVDLRDGAMWENRLSARTRVAADEPFDVDRRLRAEPYERVVPRLVTVPVLDA